MARSAVVPHSSAFTAMHLGLLEVIDLDNAADGYFFATQLPFRLNIAPANIQPAGTVLGLTRFFAQGSTHPPPSRIRQRGTL